MAAISGLVTNSSGVNYPAICVGDPKLLFQNHKHGKFGSSICQNGIWLLTRRITGVRTRYHLQRQCSKNYSETARGNYQKLSFTHDSDMEPFWLNLIKEAIWSVRNLLVFLAEQPSQLKYIEWPNFHETLKTAFLTLVIVALLIVALASVDSALCYGLSLFLWRKA